MSASDKRVAELLDRWLASVELHARYLELDDAAYAQVQDWPRHQRPTKWVVELARVRLLELKRQLDERQSQGDTAFAASLELMGFLTTLLGAEHLERYIPQALPRPATEPGPLPPAGTPTTPKPPSAGAAKVGAAMTATVMADAVRFLSWGRHWPQLASSIARLAGRPPEQVIWQILRENRAAIESQARRPPD